MNTIAWPSQPSHIVALLFSMLLSLLLQMLLLFSNDEDGSVQLVGRRPDNRGVMAAVLRTAIISISGLFKNVVA